MQEKGVVNGGYDKHYMPYESIPGRPRMQYNR